MTTPNPTPHATQLNPAAPNPTASNPANPEANTNPHTRTSRLTLALARLTRRLMPPARATWADAMANELPHLPSDPAALRWALGALSTALLERASAIVGSAPLRTLLTLPLLFQAVSVAFAPALILAIRSGNTPLASFIGAFTPGDDYHRFLPLVALAPTLYAPLGLLSAALTLAAAVQLLRRHRSALPLFLFALAAELAGEALMHLTPGYTAAARQVFAFPNPNPFRDLIVPVIEYLRPAVLAIALWLALRSTPSTPGLTSTAQ